MNSLTLSKPLKNANPDCADLITMAEHELAAFFSAVTQLFGSEQAERSAEDWLQEVEAIDDLPASTHEWRLITAKATKRLTSRVAPVAYPMIASKEEKRTCVFSSHVPQVW